MHADVLESFKDENGDLKDALRSDVDALLSLYEAAHLGKCDEDLLSRAVVFTTDCLSSLAKRNGESTTCTDFTDATENEEARGHALHLHL